MDAKNGLKLNTDKTAVLIYSRGAEAQINLPNVNTVHTVKFLGVHIDDNLRFETHVNEVCKKLRSAIFCLKSIRDWAGVPLLRSTYFALFESSLRYGILAWGNLPKFQVLRLVRLQKWALRTITRKRTTQRAEIFFQNSE